VKPRSNDSYADKPFHSDTITLDCGFEDVHKAVCGMPASLYRVMYSPRRSARDLASVSIQHRSGSVVIHESVDDGRHGGYRYGLIYSNNDDGKLAFQEVSRLLTLAFGR
jgi:hypothetical protein